MPGPISFTHSGLIAASTDKVWALLGDPARFPEWIPHCRRVAPQDAELRVGQTYHIELGHTKNRVEIQIIDYQPPTALGWVELRRRVGSKTFFRLEFEGGYTRLTVKHIWLPRSFRSWLFGQWFRRRDAWRTFNGTLQNLRKVLTR